MKSLRIRPNRHFSLLAGTSLTSLIAFSVCAYGQEVEQVTVSGIRESIEHSIAVKRESATVMDAITAEDIGKLPDQNVVDTLQRITGVQIDRGGRGTNQQSTLGEGTGFTIRGISQNRVEFNGANLTGAGDSGSVQLGDFNPEILAGLTVSKTPAAETAEGAIGGVVNLITKKPLDLDQFFASGRVEGMYLDQAAKPGYRASAMASTKFFNDTVGILVGASHYDYDRENQQFNTDGWVQTNNIDGNGDGKADAGLIRPNRMVFDMLYANIKRTGLDGSVQWKPSSDLEINFDYGYTQVDLVQNANRFQNLLTDAVTNAQADQNGTVVRATYTAPTVRSAIYDEQTHSIQTIYSLYGKWTPGTDWQVEAHGAHSTGKFRLPIHVPLLVPKTGLTASITTDFASGADIPTTILNTNFNITDYNNYQLVSISDAETDRSNTGDEARLDVTYSTNWGWLSSVKFGARYEDLNFSTTGLNSNLTGAQIIALNPSDDTNKNGVIDASEIKGETFGGLPTNNFLTDATGVFPRTWLAGAENATAVRAGLGVPNPPPDPTRVGAVQQATEAVYVQANLAGTLFGLETDGNAGIRYVTTSRDSSGNIIVPSGAVPSSSKADFNDILPSANLKVSLTDDLLVRLAAAEVIARPALSSVIPTTSLNIVSFTASQGNPNLNPYKATQFDTSVEWYFAPASILSVAGFYKDVSSFTVNTTTSQFFNYPPNSGNYLVTQPQNGTNGSVEGVEIGYQQVFQDMPEFFDGLGAGLNYTYVQSSTPIVSSVTGAFDPMPGLSKHSLNATVFIEKEWGNLRLTYNWRSKYLDVVQTKAVGGDLYQGAYGQLDFSSQFVLTDHVKLNIEAVNLTKNPETAYSVFPSRLRDYSINDRRIYFGISASL